jgi:hypothetical protein
LRTRSSILKYRGANSVEIFQAPIPGNWIIQAAQSSCKKFQVSSSDSEKATMDYLRQGTGLGVAAVRCASLRYATAGTLNRVLAGTKPGPEGPEFQLVDPIHNLPAKGQRYYDPTIDYKAVYTKAWRAS